MTNEAIQPFFIDIEVPYVKVLPVIHHMVVLTIEGGLMKILNLTGKKASDLQISDGLIDPPEGIRVEILSLLDFSELPDANMMRGKASRLSDIPVKMRFKMALLDCPPYFVSALESALRQKGVLPVYSFEKEVFAGDILENGALKGFIEKQHHKWVLPYTSLDSLPIRISKIPRVHGDR